MASTPKNRTTSKSVPGRNAPKRPPVRSGRPAGLFTWLAVGLVVVVVAGLVIIKVATGGSSTGGSSAFQLTDPTTLSELTTVPTSVFNTVGVTSPIAQVTPPEPVKGQPLLAAATTTGHKLPEILYVGAEYCPYCAAQRWATIIALSRFGTWSHLGDTSSGSQDIYPGTPTFTFVKATYASKYFVFKGVEEFTNVISGSFYTSLQKPTAQENAIVKKYDTPKYINGLSLSQAGAIPFITFANQFLVAGASYSPTTLAGSSRSAIAAGLSNSTSPITQAIIASANYQSAALCTLSKQQPASVCATPGVKAADKVMRIK